jgi:hypothetical protein
LTRFNQYAGVLISNGVIQLQSFASARFKSIVFRGLFAGDIAIFHISGNEGAIPQVGVANSTAGCRDQPDGLSLRYPHCSAHVVAFNTTD